MQASHVEDIASYESDANAKSEHLANGAVPDDANLAGLADTTIATIATVGAVGVAAVVLEAALIPGMILGVAAALAPGYVPRLGAAINPILRSGVRGAYKLGHRTREMVSEAREHLNDIAAEVEAEKDTAVSANGSTVKSSQPAHD